MSEPRRVVVLGHRGMLGHVVCRVFFEAGWCVSTTESRFDGSVRGELFDAVAAADPEVIVNCAAATGARASERELYVTNGLLPQLLASMFADRLLIHASTDGVFDGARGAYSITESPNAREAYGLSKRLGERCIDLGRAVVLRTSIIGPEQGTARSLLSWYLLQDEPVRGFVDVRWNGVTSLQWARLALRAALGEPGLGAGVHHPTTTSVVSKAELLGAVREAFGRGPRVDPMVSGRAVDRSLVPTLESPPLAQQLQELAMWYERL